MHPFSADCFELARKNNFFRTVLYTTERTQLVLMSIPAHGEIGEEIHEVDQTLIFVSGSAQAFLNDVPSTVQANDIVIVPAGTKHNFKNSGSTDLKLITLYTPPHHKPGIVHRTKIEADADTSDHY